MIQATIAIAMAVDGAHFVSLSEFLGVLYVWKGGSTVNVYSLNSGDCVDCFTLDAPSREDVHDAIQSHSKDRSR